MSKKRFGKLFLFLAIFDTLFHGGNAIRLSENIAKAAAVAKDIHFSKYHLNETAKFFVSIFQLDSDSVPGCDRINVKQTIQEKPVTTGCLLLDWTLSWMYAAIGMSTFLFIVSVSFCCARTFPCDCCCSQCGCKACGGNLPNKSYNRATVILNYCFYAFFLVVFLGSTTAGCLCHLEANAALQDFGEALLSSIDSLVGMLNQIGPSTLIQVLPATRAIFAAANRRLDGVGRVNATSLGYRAALSAASAAVGRVSWLVEGCVADSDSCEPGVNSSFWNPCSAGSHPIGRPALLRSNATNPACRDSRGRLAACPCCSSCANSSARLANALRSIPEDWSELNHPIDPNSLGTAMAHAVGNVSLQASALISALRAARHAAAGPAAAVFAIHGSLDAAAFVLWSPALLAILCAILAMSLGACVSTPAAAASSASGDNVVPAIAIAFPIAAPDDVNTISTATTTTRGFCARFGGAGGMGHCCHWTACALGTLWLAVAAFPVLAGVSAVSVPASAVCRIMPLPSVGGDAAAAAGMVLAAADTRSTGEGPLASAVLRSCIFRLATDDMIDSVSLDAVGSSGGGGSSGWLAGTASEERVRAAMAPLRHGGPNQAARERLYIAAQARPWFEVSGWMETAAAMDMEFHAAPRCPFNSSWEEDGSGWSRDQCLLDYEAYQAELSFELTSMQFQSAAAGVALDSYQTAAKELSSNISTMSLELDRSASAVADLVLASAGSCNSLRTEYERLRDRLCGPTGVVTALEAVWGLLLVAALAWFPLAVLLLRAIKHAHRARLGTPPAQPPSGGNDRVLDNPVAQGADGGGLYFSVSPEVFNFNGILTLPECPKPSCLEFFTNLIVNYGIDEKFFQRTHDRCYCVRCYPSSLPSIINKGAPNEYIIPRGWVRIGIGVLEGPAAQNKIFEEWTVSFHGTPARLLKSILNNGIAMPGDKLLGGKTLQSTNSAGRQDRCFYTSPTIRYAGLGFYARPEYFTGCDGRLMAGQVVLQCRQQPGSFESQAETMGFRSRWNQEEVCNLLADQNKIERTSNIPKALVPYGLLLRVFSRGHPPEHFKSPVDPQDLLF